MIDELIYEIKDWLRLNTLGLYSDRLTLDYIKVVLERCEKQMND